MLTPRVNRNLKIRWEEPFLIIDDVLENVDEFRAQLWAEGNFSHAQGSSLVPDVGPSHNWRQVLSSEKFPAEFREAIAEFQMVAPDERTLYNTNCLFSDMKVETRRARASYYPHSDWHGEGEIPIVFNLWLHDGGGGTGFFTYDGHHSLSSMSPELRHFAENYIDASSENLDEGSALQAYNSDFRGNDEWKLWKVAEMKKNRAFVYCGDLWHRVLIPRGEFTYPNARYSFVAFSKGGSDRFLDQSGARKLLAQI